jgi:3-isopropylmalate/(R)-2-methylmalate dehydratase small subunit
MDKFISITGLAADVFEKCPRAAILISNGFFDFDVNAEQTLQYFTTDGVKTVIAPMFTPVFTKMALQNGVLPITLPKEQIEQLLQNVSDRPGYKLTVDLESQTVSDEFGLSVPFEVDPFYKRCLMDGVDIVSFALSAEKAIESYEDKWGK